MCRRYDIVISADSEEVGSSLELIAQPAATHQMPSDAVAIDSDDDHDAALAWQLQDEEDAGGAAAAAGRRRDDYRSSKSKPRCPETRRAAGGVLLVCEHHQHGACLVIFHNRGRGREWECPYGRFDGPPKHRTIVDTAAEELWEETCALVAISPELLLNSAQRSERNAGIFALRVDGLSRKRHTSNLAAVRALRHQHGVAGLGSCLEMDSMTFLPLVNLERADLAAKPATARDVDGVERVLSSYPLARHLREGGLELARRAFVADDVRQKCDVVETADPVRQLKGCAVQLSGVHTCVISKRLQ